MGEIGVLSQRAPFYAPVVEDDAATRLQTIDVSLLQLVLLTDAGEGHPASSEAGDPMDTRIDSNLARFRADGFVFLDARAMLAILQYPALIPERWLALTESESGPPESKGSIRFYGTRFPRLDGSAVEVLGISACRGRWSITLEPVGHVDRPVYAPGVSIPRESTWASGD